MGNEIARLNMDADEIKRRFAEAAERMALSPMEKHWQKGELIVLQVDRIEAKASENSHERLYFRMVDPEARISPTVEERLLPKVPAKEIRAGIEKGHAVFSVVYLGLRAGGRYGKYHDFRVEPLDDATEETEAKPSGGWGIVAPAAPAKPVK